MKKANIALLILLALFEFGGLKGKLVFGHGTGDAIYVILSVVAFFVSVTWFSIISMKEKTSLQGFLFIFILAALILLCLKATIFRGPEYSWHAHPVFFY